MSVQYAIDDVALEYQLDPPVLVTAPAEILVFNDAKKITSAYGTRMISAGVYSVNADPTSPSDLAAAKAFVNNRAANALYYADGLAANAAQAGSTNGNIITLPSGGNGSIYPSIKIISGVVGTIKKLQVVINGLSHTRPSDVRCGLSGPDGTKTFVFCKCGGSSTISGVNLLFDDSAAAPLNAGGINAGTYQCSDPFGFVATNNPFWTFTTTAPGGLWNVLNLSQFNGKNPNGTWNLWALSDNPGDLGSILSFDLVITLTEPTPI